MVYYLSDHPSVVGFRWGQPGWFGTTWLFLFSSIFLYIVSTLILHTLLLLLFRHRRPLPLGPIPAVHSLGMILISLFIFSGILLSVAAEIRDMRGLWRRHYGTSPVQWLLCFPVGTRTSGRVFFWSYLYYLSRYLHALCTFIALLRCRRISLLKLFNNSILIFMSFLWLEFSQSFQIIAILLATSFYSVVYGYRFWTAIGLPAACFPIVVNCRILLLSCNLICHFAVLLLHYIKGGCNGIGAWVFNSVLNGAILLLFVCSHVGKWKRRRRSKAVHGDAADKVVNT
ncbi:hypothetical protein M569_16899 [Genlisea aurea]|uniref:Elongation of fatty acids protein 3-like n=1 Tax=Genlisea aurea TaxID=192259 RepID=S8D5M5_9LAMI|nr:hypothetical protein M569_16899 [Genlisea aurea]